MTTQLQLARDIYDMADSGENSALDKLRVDKLRTLLLAKDGPGAVNWENPARNGKTCLLAAVSFHNSIAVCELLLSQKANVDAKDRVSASQRVCA